MRQSGARPISGPSRQARVLAADRHGLIPRRDGHRQDRDPQVLAEGFSRRGARLRGRREGGPVRDRRARLRPQIGAARASACRAHVEGCPVAFWECSGAQGAPRARGHRVRPGPAPARPAARPGRDAAGRPRLVFRIADDDRLLLLDIKDLRAILQHVGDNAAQLQGAGTATSRQPPSVPSSGACSGCEQDGAGRLFGEPALDIADLMQTDGRAGGDREHPRCGPAPASPRCHSTFLLWISPSSSSLARGWRSGQAEARLLLRRGSPPLFSEAPKALLDRVDQVVRLIRSKASASTRYPNPLDMPDSVLGQLGTGYTRAARLHAADQKTVTGGGQTLRPTRTLDTEQGSQSSRWRGPGVPARRAAAGRAPSSGALIRLRRAGSGRSRPEARREIRAPSSPSTTSGPSTASPRTKSSRVRPRASTEAGCGDGGGGAADPAGG